MTLTLVGAIDASQNNVQLSGDLDAQPGDLFRLDDELVEFGAHLALDRQHAVSLSLCSFGRGAEGTTAASHTSGTELLGAVEAVEAGMTSEPPLPFADGGVSGSGAVVSDTDPGAIGAGNLWLQTNVNAYEQQLWVRDAADTGWLVAGAVIFQDATTLTLSSPNDVAELFLSDNSGSNLSTTNPNGFQVYAVKLVLNFTSQAELFADTIDPSAGGGLSTFKGSLLLRDAGELWLKTGSGATDWSRIGTQAAHVADGSTVDQLRDALIASGLMAAS